MLGQVEIDSFWAEVERQLQIDRPHTTPEQRVRAILRYRKALASADVNRMVYHREPAQVAQDIEAGEFVTT